MVKRIAVIGLAIILLLISFTGVSCDSDEDNDIGITTLPEGFIWYQNDGYSFKMAYPEDWAFQPLSAGDESIVIIREFFPPPDVDINGIIEVSTSTHDMSYLDDKAESKEEVIINGRKGYSFIWKYKVSHETDAIQWHTVKNNTTVLNGSDKYYIIRCATDEEVWDEDAYIFDTAIRSFVIE